MTLFSILFACILVPLQPSISSFAGNFKIQVESVDGRRVKDNDFAESRWYVARMNRSSKKIVGTIKVKKLVVRPFVQIETFTWSKDQFKKLGLEKFRSQSLCENGIKGRFFDKAFNGNATWTDKCIIEPGFLQLREDYDINGVVHEFVDRTLYGKYQIKTTVVDEKRNIVTGIDWIVIIKPA